MKDFEIINEIGSDLGQRGEDYNIPYLRIDNELLTKNGYKVGDKVKITISSPESTIWHTFDELPNRSCNVLMYDVKYGKFGIVVGHYSKGLNIVLTDEAPEGMTLKWNNVIWYDRWCYVDDIKPKKL